MSAMRFRLVSAASTNLTQVKQWGANLVGGVLINTNAAARFVKFYDQTNTPVVGTDPVVLTVQVPATSQVLLSLPVGPAFKQTMYIATTVNAVDSDATVVGAGDLIISLFVE